MHPTSDLGAARRRPTAVLPRSRDATETLARAREHLLGLQHVDGWWKGELQVNVTMDAEQLLMQERLGIRRSDQTERVACWIRAQQRDDGTWANFHGGPAVLSTTIEAYVALRLAGDPTDAAHMRRAAAFVRGAGGLQGARVFTHIWLAMFGLWPWEQVPALPPELVLMPPWAPLNIYRLACWARQAIVPLTIVIAARPVHKLPFAVHELTEGGPHDAGPPWGRTANIVDRLLRAYQAYHPRGLRRLALAQAERWIIERQEADGSFGGMQPSMVYSPIALHLRGYSLEHPVMRSALTALDAFNVDRDGMRRLEGAQSPTWDTALAMIALREAKLPASHPALVRAADWLLDREAHKRGDWAVRRPGLEPSGWAFEFANQNYPDTDDTSIVALALRQVEHPAPKRLDAAVDRARRWVIGMQSKDGGWGAYDADNYPSLRLPFFDFGEIFDPPSVDVTAHVIEMLAEEDLAEHPSTRAGIRWVLERQERDGSWYGRWGVNHVYGVGAVLPALIAAGIPASEPCIRRAVSWLESHQNDDGGWGEDPRSYDDPAWIGRGRSTPSQTAWALLALHAAGQRSPAVDRGLGWLIAAQRPDGDWDEPAFTGTGFPGYLYLNYELYRIVFPVMALGRVLRGGETERDERA